MTTRIDNERRPLPAGWHWKRLSNILTNIENGSRPRGGVSGISTGILSIGAEHISEDGELYLANPRYIPEEFYSRMSKGVVNQGDILLVKDGATTGRIAIVEEILNCGLAVNEHVFILRPDKANANSLYTYYVLRSPFGQRSILNSFHGAAQGGITQGFAKAVWIPFPSTLLEQEQIAANVKAKIAEVKRLRQKSELQLRAAQALLKNIVDQEMGRFSQPNGHLIDVLRSPPTSGWPLAYGNDLVGIPFLTLTAVLNFKYDGTQIKYTDKSVDEHSDYWAQPGDIFMSRSNTPELVGQAAIYDGKPERVVYPDLLIRLQVDTAKADIRFVHYWLMSHFARSYITSNARGSSGTMKKVTLEMVQKCGGPIELDTFQGVVRGTPRLAEFESATKRSQTLPGSDSPKRSESA